MLSATDPWWWRAGTQEAQPPTAAAVVAAAAAAAVIVESATNAAISLEPTTNNEANKNPFQVSKQFGLCHELSEEFVQVRIEGFDFFTCDFAEINQQLVLSVKLVCGDSFETPTVSTVCSKPAGASRAKWGDNLQLPYKLCDLSLDAYFEFTLHGPPSTTSANSLLLGRARFMLFSRNTGVLRIGKQEVDICSTLLGDGTTTTLTSEDSVANHNELAFEREESQRRFAAKTCGPAWLNKMAEERVLALRRARRGKHHGNKIGVLAIELFEFDGVPIIYEPHSQIVTLTLTADANDDAPSAPQRRRQAEDPIPELSNVRKEEEMPNVVEEKLYLMRRSVTRRKGEDPSIVPNHKEWKQIDLILSNPFSKPKNEEEDLLWKFRYSLVRDSRALTKVLNSVKWDSEEEVVQVQKLLEKWESAEFSDVLRLLSGEITEHPIVRAYAVKVLANSKHSVLHLYLPQLVQALRHDKISVDKETSQGPLQRFLITKCSEDFELASCLHWLLKVEMLLARPPKIGAQASPFSTVFQNYTEFLRVHSPRFFARIRKQDEFVTYFINVADELMSMHGADTRRTRQLVSSLESYPFTGGEPVTLTGFPHGIFVGVKRKSVRILSSTTSPTVVDLIFEETVAVEQQEEPKQSLVRLMFKVGDDMRQDQLVLQLINLMDGLFKKSGLDLEMTVYRVLATGTNKGVIEFVSDAVPLSKVTSEFRTIRNFLLQCNNPALYSTVLDKFIRSCAGYAVVTYVLGIGDRHLDNILILPTGRMFHIDFGYSFGRDKRLATPVRITADMLDTMGKEGEIKFRTLCWEAFKSLRAQAALILSVVGLMADAAIPDLQQTTVALAGMQERLKINMSDEEAERSLNAMITQSVSAFGPQFIEYMHALGQTRARKGEE